MILNSAKGLLELYEIDCFVKNEYHASGGHVGFGSIPIELWVQDSDEAGRAISILEKELNPGKEKAGWECKHCGEGNDGSFEICWKCQRAAIGT
tara:strand:- start:4473 stop:4754 length:282 start_codon:yes stop_codon:yes gene_type:complete